MKYEYIHSGIDWIGNVPKHWRKEKIFRAAELITSGGTPRSGNEEYYEGDIYWIQSGDLNDGYVTDTEKKITKEGLNNSSAKLFPAGTLLVAMYGATIGKLGIQTMEAATNQACCGIYPTKRIDLKFLFYFFHAVKDKYISDSYGGGQPNISQSLIKQTYFFIPDKPEQIAIAKYLDKAFADIDRVVEIKRKQIENLQNQLKSIIHLTVTKGLNPNAETKESGINWIGKLPKHWKIDRFSNVVFFQEGPGILGVDFREEGIPLIRISGVKGDVVSLEGCNYLEPEMVMNKWEHFKLNEGDLLISCSASTGLISEVKEETIGAIPYTGLIRLTPLYNKILKDYIKIFVTSDVYLVQIDLQKKGTTIEHYGPTHLKRMFILVPPKSEQLEIIKFTDGEIEKVRKAQTKIEKQIEVLLNYKKSLIHEVVTGKKQVFSLTKEKQQMQTAY